MTTTVAVPTASARRAQERAQRLAQYVNYMQAKRQDESFARSCALVRPKPFVLVVAQPRPLSLRARVAGFFARVVAALSAYGRVAAGTPQPLA